MIDMKRYRGRGRGRGEAIAHYANNVNVLNKLGTISQSEYEIGGVFFRIFLVVLPCSKVSRHISWIDKDNERKGKQDLYMG